MRVLGPTAYVIASLAACSVVAIVACSSGRPPAIDLDHDGGSDSTVFTVPSGDGGASGDASASDASTTDAGADSGADSGAPSPCADTIQDGAETDVDCGGNQCAKCIDGKNCIADTDCAGGSCVNKKCMTATCNDQLLNGVETDTDCGGGSCAKCTFGKRCTAATDCVSGVCTGQQCSCPAQMVVVTIPNQLGGSYCMDQTEVTNGQYDRFIKANQPTTQQIDECKPPVNTTFVPPGGTWPPPQPLSDGDALPVRNVDWCDAMAYCTWAGKELCGKIGGGANATTDFKDQTKSAWYNGCSAQGQNLYPYGGSFDANRCDVGGSGPKPVCKYSNDGTYAGELDPALRTCQGGFTGLYEMSGDVAEWENSCDTNGCLVRGGSYLSAAAEATCTSTQTVAKTTTLPSLGFRCCQY